jgi:hypothetical protein
MKRARTNSGIKVVEFLLQKGTNVDARGSKYRTALKAAAYHDRFFFEILLKHGADPNIDGGRLRSHWWRRG